MEDQLPLATAREILRTMPAIMREITSALRREKFPLMPAQLGVLAALSVQSCNLSELAEQSGVSLPTMSSTISYMVGQGWVQRTRSTYDRRVILLELSSDGRAVFDECISRISEILLQQLQPLSATDLQNIYQGLSLLQTVFIPYDV